MENLTIIKVGGKIVEEEGSLDGLLSEFVKIEGYKMLVHGGGGKGTKLAERLGIESKIVDGRRITDSATLELVTMVYGGLVNKNIVVKLQALGLNAFGLTGADMNAILSHKRPVKEIDYGYVGDVEKVNTPAFFHLISHDVTPVLAPLTHDGKGNLLNTNADTIASETAQSLSSCFDVTLVYCFEKKGVLIDENDDDSVIPYIDKLKYAELKKNGIIKAGMLPKLDNAFRAIENGVKRVIITQASDISKNCGTIIQ